MKALPDSIPARGATASASRSPHIGQLARQSFAAMTARERARLIAMYGVIAVVDHPLQLARSCTAGSGGFGMA